MHIHLDAVGGVAGDMFVAAMLDAFPDLREGTLHAIRSAGLPEDIACRVVAHRDHALTGARFLVEEPPYRPHDRGLALAEEGHRHTPFREVRARLEAAPLAPGVKARAIRIFALLAEAEGKVHGMPAEEVSFHELGGWDSIADMVGAAYVIDTLDASLWSVSPLPRGSGQIKTDHGRLPVPTPATALLLEGYALIDDGLPGERVTPTGAAILKAVGATQAPVGTPRRLLRTGSGFGTKIFPGISNVLRALVFEEAAVEAMGSLSERVGVIAFEVDDQSLEDLAIGLDHLRAHPGVLDVLQMPAYGKKGRISVHVQVLAQPDALERVVEACFGETATLGLRCQIVERRVLPRQQDTVEVEGRPLRVKIAQRSGLPTVKVESDDLRTLPGGRAARESARREGEAQGLKKNG